MVVEKVNFPFLHESSLKDYIKTLHEIDCFGAIQTDSASRRDYEIYNACKYAREKIQQELDDLALLKEVMYKELDAKYGERYKDYYVTMDGSVHIDRKDGE